LGKRSQAKIAPPQDKRMERENSLEKVPDAFKTAEFCREAAEVAILP
jgi:hypothetical protein